MGSEMCIRDRDAAYDAFVAALQNAKAVLTDPESEQAVAEAKAALTEAYANLKLIEMPEPEPTPTPEPHTHDFQLISDTTTCTAAGTKTYQCSCGETKTEESAALGHSGVKQPDGSLVCSRCNEVLQAAPAPEPVTPSEPTTESDTPTE